MNENYEELENKDDSRKKSKRNDLSSFLFLYHHQLRLLRLPFLFAVSVFV